MSLRLPLAILSRSLLRTGELEVERGKKGRIERHLEFGRGIAGERFNAWALLWRGCDKREASKMRQV